MFDGGFFLTEEVAVTKPIGSVSGCGACGLYKGCHHPKMKESGEGRKGILVIGEAPGPMEDRKGEQLIGDAGQLLRRVLQNQGIDLDRDCKRIDSVSCRPPEDRTPAVEEVGFCHPRVWDLIHEFRPHLILLLGGSAVQSFLQHRWKHKNLGGIIKWRGWTIPDRDTESWTVATYHPNYVLERSQKNPVIEKIFVQDIKRGLQMLDHPFPAYQNETEKIHLLEDEKETYAALLDIYKRKPWIAFDYETTGLKPHAKGHEIASCSIGEKDENTFAFMMPKEGRNLELFKKIMTDPDIGKIAQNLKFEDNWTNVILKCPVNGWIWDTMIATHILDNREEITGLKFQSYVQFGVLDYSSHVDPFLKAGESNGFNKIHSIPKRELLIYNGVDSLLEMRLALKQMKELNYVPTPS